MTFMSGQLYTWGHGHYQTLGLILVIRATEHRIWYVSWDYNIDDGERLVYSSLSEQAACHAVNSGWWKLA